MYPHQVKLSSKKSAMINLSQLNKLIYFSLFFTVLIFNICLSEDEPADIWENQDTNIEDNNKVKEEEKKSKRTNVVLSAAAVSAVAVFGLIMTL